MFNPPQLTVHFYGHQSGGPFPHGEVRRHAAGLANPLGDESLG